MTDHPPIRPPAPRFDPAAVILTATSRWHYHQHPTGQLSIKTMANGRAIYRLGGGRVIAVDGSGYLILNDRQPYTIEIESPAALTSFCIFFPEGQAADVLRGLTAPEDTLLADPGRPAPAPEFFATLTPHDDTVSPAMRRIQAAAARGPIEAGWLEQQTAALLARMAGGQRALFEASARIDAARASTRLELHKRLLIARDFMHANFAAPVGLAGIAAAAALSPYHFLRAYRQLFGETPHATLTRLRLDHARYLLAHTDWPVGEVCYALGFTSLGSFSALFRRGAGLSPQGYRAAHRRELRKIREAEPGAAK